MVVEEKVTEKKEEKLCKFFLHGEGEVLVKDDENFTLNFKGAPFLVFIDEEGRVIKQVSVTDLNF